MTSILYIFSGVSLKPIKNKFFLGGCYFCLPFIHLNFFGISPDQRKVKALNHALGPCRHSGSSWCSDPFPHASPLLSPPSPLQTQTRVGTGGWARRVLITCVDVAKVTWGWAFPDHPVHPSGHHTPGLTEHPGCLALPAFRDIPQSARLWTTNCLVFQQRPDWTCLHSCPGISQTGGHPPGNGDGALHGRAPIKVLSLSLSHPTLFFSWHEFNSTAT